MEQLLVEDQRKKHEAVLRPLTQAHGFEQVFEHGDIVPDYEIRALSGHEVEDEAFVSRNAYNRDMPKIRLDVLLVERGLAESRAKAQALIMAGQVRVAGQVALKPATTVDASAALTVDSGPRFVSRGGEKLDAALEAFAIDVNGFVCADVGASTGGFTDCLLQRGAAKVYAMDVWKGILHWKLRNDARVVIMEGTNARFVESFPEPIDLVTIDASFISLKVLLPVVKRWSLPSPPSPLPQGEGSEG